MASARLRNNISLSLSRKGPVAKKIAWMSNSVWVDWSATMWKMEPGKYSYYKKQK